ncbi:alpha/beta hydrolase [Streptomyces sp. NPDC050617]|uniref:alpha/beta hydrolase n=1 Tax=Streptomyces sp. NPDC050617 TaxID=3154628 RepID=UPI003439826A
MSTAEPRPTFLLVHGAWHRPTCWEPLQAALAAEGWQSRTVTLPSGGPQPTPSAGMYADAEEVSAQLRRIPGPVVVVGHSYGGFPVTQAAGDHPNVTRLVYLAAYVPEEGEYTRGMHGAPQTDDLEGSVPGFEDARGLLYQDLTDEQAELAIGRLVEQSKRSFHEPITQAAWRTVPSTYVLCEQDRALKPAMQEKMAARTGRVERIARSHSPFLSAPAELAALLGSIASTQD